jgi:hypothetical protein
MGDYFPSYESHESVYGLIPAPIVVPERPAMHRSRHDGEVDPGKFPMGVPKRNTGTFGPANKLSQPNPKVFLKKHVGEPVLPDPRKPAEPKTKLKAPLPNKNERPIMGLVSAKNYITANAVENILAQPKRLPPEPVPATMRADFGKVPGYLKTVRKQIDHEKAIVAEFNNRMAQQTQQASSTVKKMSEDERQDLIVALKARWKHVNAAYQKLSFTLDTPAKRTRKEKYEEQLVQIEKDIETLSRRVVLVAEDDY